ncbi:MAG: SDR family NAD(P)-dependent oxidoreductase [Maioricimonas sp. JB049]
MKTLTKLALLAGGATAAAMAAKQAIRKERWFSFAGKSVLVTGGSRGLGLVLARQLIDQGARVTITARTKADLDAAREELEQRGGDVLSIPCDIRDQQQVQQLVEKTLERFGTIDVLLNVAGIIVVGPLETMTREDFQKSMDTHCWGTLNTVQAVLPTMRQRGWGRIVNVASLGGKRSVPHMLPYCTSKFALVGLSNGLRTELAEENIFVTTICPSLMRTGSPRNAIFKGQHRKEYAWFCIGDSLPMAAMPADEAARQILQACQYGDAEKIVRNPGNVGVMLQQMFSGVTRDLLTVANRYMPDPGGIGQASARGYQSESRWAPSLLTRLTQKAARRNNEMRPHPVE